MKKFILLLVTVTCAFQINAQKIDFWLDAGVKAQYGFTALYNSNATNGGEWDNTITTGIKYGAKFGINFNYVGVSLDILTGNTKGEFQDLGNNEGGDREITVNSTDLYLLFRSAKNKGYFEIGPKYSFIGDIRSTEGTANLEDFYESNNLGGVIGFGTYILGPEDGRFSGILGLRFEYGFQDLTNEAGRALETRQPVPYPGEAASTNPIFVGLVFELNWGIGGVGQARCGERAKFIWF